MEASGATFSATKPNLGRKTMHTIRLQSRSYEILHSGIYPSVKDAVESALREGVCLDRLRLHNADLRDINLDGIHLRDIDFSGCNLTGANLSESTLQHCNFSDCQMFNACLCYSNLEQCVFHNTEFGGTDISETILKACLFSGPSTFGLHFITSSSMSDSSYMDEDGQILPMTKPPVVILGLLSPIRFLDLHVLTDNGTRRKYASTNS